MKKPAYFKKYEIVRWVETYYPMQILKIKWDDDDNPIYKIRYYNSLLIFTGVWVPESELKKF